MMTERFTVPGDPSRIAGLFRILQDVSGRAIIFSPMPAVFLSAGRPAPGPSSTARPAPWSTGPGASMPSRPR